MAFGTGSQGFNPDRRKFLKGALATGVVLAFEGKAAHAEQPFELSPQQRAIREQGIKEMQQSAATEAEEITRYFVAYPNGRAEWKKVKLEQKKFGGPESGGGIMAALDYRAVDDMLTLTSKGAFVENMHTHPTSIEKDMGEDFKNVGGIPPSPPDFINAVLFSQQAGAGFERLKFSAVTERGVWKYGPSSKKAAEDFSKAIETPVPIIRVLENNKRAARDIGRTLRSFTKNNGVPLPKEIVRAFENASVTRVFEENPMSLASMNELMNMLDTDTLSPDAKKYFEKIKEAHTALVIALKKIAPESDGAIETLPTHTNVDSYKKRWKALGMNIDFVPNKKP